jgi:hypothetical protein
LTPDKSPRRNLPSENGRHFGLVRIRLEMMEGEQIMRTFVIEEVNNENVKYGEN